MHIIFNIQKEPLGSACNYNHSVLSFIYLVSFHINSNIIFKTFISIAHLFRMFLFVFLVLLSN